MDETMLLKDFFTWVKSLSGEEVGLQGFDFLKGKTLVELGRLYTSSEERTVFFKYGDPQVCAFKKLHDQVGQALTRAGFQRPRIDPTALHDLLETVDSTHDLIEIIAETSCLSNGSLHFLLDVLQDRCRLYLTGVTLRELQDLVRPGTQHAALAATRLKEQPPPGVIIDEIPMDDVALMLSRAGVKSGNKSSESDTLILRLARQKILAQVRGVRTLFVVTDTDLTRRATTELPKGSVLALDHRHAVPNRTYLPCEWWPHKGRSRRTTVADAGRLLWEFLPHFGHLEIQVSQKTYILRAHRPGGKMWPSDYLNPWVCVSQKMGVPQKPQPKVPKTSTSPSLGSKLFKSVSSPSMPDISRAFWPSRGIFFDALIKIVHSGALDSSVTQSWSKNAQQNLAPLLNGLGWLTPGEQPRVETLRACISSNDREALAALLRPWTLFRKVAFDGWSTRQNKTSKMAFASAKSIAEALGFIFRKQWGGANPTLADIREALLTHLKQVGTDTLTVQSLLLDVFLKQLHVGPARVHAVWHRLVKQGVFHGFDLREGGTSQPSKEKVVVFSDEGWRMKPISLDAIAGVRDLVRRTH